MSSLRSIDGFDDELVAEGAQGEPWPGDVASVGSGVLQTLVVTIYGGAMEVQKNIIARLAFGL